MKKKLIIILPLLLVFSIVSITVYSLFIDAKKEISNNRDKEDTLTKNIDDNANNENIDILRKDREIKEQTISKKLVKEDNKKEYEKNMDNVPTEQQDNNVNINNQDNNSIENSGQNNYSQENNQDNNQNDNPTSNPLIQDNNNSVSNSNSSPSNNSNNQIIQIPIDLNDEAVDTDPNDDIYPTSEACNQAGIELMLRLNNSDIINTFCFTYSENGKFLGYRLDINCISGNCDKYK